MKKILYFIGAAGLLLNGCKEPAVEDAAFAPESSAVRTLTVNGVVETGTRAVWDDKTNFAWENDDQITLVSGSKSYESDGLEVDESNPGHGLFTVSVGSESSYNAFVTANGKYNDGSVEFTVGDTEITAGKVSLKSNVLLVSTSSVEPEGEELNVPLTIVTPLVKFLVYGETQKGETIESISIKANAANIAGTASYSFDGNKVTVSEGKALVTATVSDATVAASKDAAEGLYLSVLPTTVNDITYVVTTSTKTYNFTSKSGQTFAQNTIYTLPLNLANADADAGVEVTDVTVEDGGTDNKFYLGKTVTVTGTNLDKVSVVKIGNTEISNVEAESTTMTFTVPDDLDFGANSPQEETAKEFTLTIDEYTEQITVYPFYYYKDVVLGARDDANRDCAFFVPDFGRVISTDEFATYRGDYNTTLSNGLDNKIGSNETKNALNKEKINENEYYDIPAYIFCTVNSGTSLVSLQSPSNSDSQIKNYKTLAKQSFPNGFGTPIVGFKNIEYVQDSKGADATPNQAERNTAEKVHSGTVSSVSDLYPRVVSSGAPEYNGLGLQGSQFKIGQVIMVQHMSYETTSGYDVNNIYRAGLMVVSNVTDAADDYKVPTSTKITFDFYWSKPLMEQK